jgi:hypothetical protein
MESMDTTWAQPWTTTDVTKLMSQKQKARALLTILSFSPSKLPMPYTSSKDMASIAAL